MLYDAHPDYIARRIPGSFEREQIDLEVRDFKLPNLLELLGPGVPPDSLLEIGCATGELIAAFPVCKGGRKVGIDISEENIRAARERFPTVTFAHGDFTQYGVRDFACVILSDVLEHVEDDTGFLRAAASMGCKTLVNLPLEDNWLNRYRTYGPTDSSGHLRNYSLDEGLRLFSRAGLSVVNYRRVWIHETLTELNRRELRRRHFGQAFSGGLTIRLLKRAVVSVCSASQPLGRRLFASNLFALAVRKGGS
jgi:SAM-dependent methyltransferase